MKFTAAALLSAILFSGVTEAKKGGKRTQVLRAKCTGGPYMGADSDIEGYTNLAQRVSGGFSDDSVDDDFGPLKIWTWWTNVGESDEYGIVVYSDVDCSGAEIPQEL